MYNECRHIFTSGKKCQSPALQNQNFCYFHSNTRKRPTRKDEAYEPYIAPQDTAHNLPQLEDADAIQLALSDVVLALAANRIDPRRARILIYGLQVASQNLNRRVPQVRGAAGAANLGSEDISSIVRETHEHEDGTLIGPAKQSPDPEEVAERKRPPSLGELLLAEVEAMRIKREAQQAERSPQSTEHPVPLQLPQILATADDTPAKSCHSLTERKRRGRWGRDGKSHAPAPRYHGRMSTASNRPTQAEIRLESATPPSLPRNAIGLNGDNAVTGYNSACTSHCKRTKSIASL